MPDQNLVRNTLGICGNVISVGLFLSPTPTFIKIIKKKDTEQFSPIPYLVTFLNCLLWIFYGMPFVKPNSTLVLTTNGIGASIESIYIIIFLIYAAPKGRIRAILILVVEMIFFVAVVVIVMLCTHTPKQKALIIGIIAIILNIGMYASPLSVVKLVIQTKSAEYLPLPLCFAGLLNGAFWFTYAMMPFDVNIAVPNGLGILFAIAQLIVIAKYWRSTPRDNTSSQVELPV